MTENEWLSSTDAAALLAWRTVSDRKLQLFACACCWAFDPFQGRTAEWNIQKKVGWGALPVDWARACVAAWARARTGNGGKVMADVLRDIVGNPFRSLSFRCHCTVLRSFPDGCEICEGDKVVPHPRYEAWLTPTVLTIAEAIYEERHDDGTLDNGCLAVLSDALEEAGCTAPAILAHLRDTSATHYRGCHVIDIILGKE